jgi:hypothetical protein
MAQNLVAADGSTTVPKILGDLGYTLREDSYVWVENPNGTDWRAQLNASAWSTSDPNRILLKALAHRCRMKLVSAQAYHQTQQLTEQLAVESMFVAW